MTIEPQPMRRDFAPIPIGCSFDELSGHTRQRWEQLKELNQERQRQGGLLKLRFSEPISLRVDRRRRTTAPEHVVLSVFETAEGRTCYVPKAYRSGRIGFDLPQLHCLAAAEIISEAPGKELTDGEIWERCDPAFITPAGLAHWQKTMTARWRAKDFCRPTEFQVALLQRFYPHFKGPATQGVGYGPDPWSPKVTDPVLRLKEGNRSHELYAEASLYHNPATGAVQVWSHRRFGGRERVSSYLLVAKDRLLRLRSEWD